MTRGKLNTAHVGNPILIFRHKRDLGAGGEVGMHAAPTR